MTNFSAKPLSWGNAKGKDAENIYPIFERAWEDRWPAVPGNHDPGRAHGPGEESRRSECESASEEGAQGEGLGAMLNLYRRHLKKCPHRAKGTGHTKCSCPVWCDGELRGRRVRESLKTRDWQRAIRRAAEMEDPKAPRVKPIVDAISAFENHILSLESSTQRKYKNVLSHFGDHCKGAGLDDLLQVDVEHLDAYRAGRRLSPTTSL